MTLQQHVRALKSLGYEPSGLFMTSAIELKLDEMTMYVCLSGSLIARNAQVSHTTMIYLSS